MKNKIIVILGLCVLFLPAVSIAMPVPQFNLTVVVKTQGSDNNFHFDLSNNQSFDLQTSNLTASKSLVVMGIGSYSFSQNNVAGMKIASIFCTSNNLSDTFWYQPNSVRFSPTLFENVTCTFNNVKAITPVLIVPGLMGTNMNKGSDKLWLDLAHNFTDIGDQFMDPLQFNQNLTPSDTNLVVGGIIGKETVNVGVGNLTVFDYTDGLINEFKKQGYVEGETLFAFPYDWRYGVSGKFADGTTNADLLAAKIQSILQQTGSSKVDVVAHSLGGLIVKEYVVSHPTDNHLGKVVFVGVPNTGAPKAVKALLQGDNFGIPWLADSEMKKIAANMPSAYDLLPSQQYYIAKGSFVKIVNTDSSTSEIIHTEKDLNYNESQSFLTGHNLNGQAITSAANLHTQNFDNFDLRTAGINLYAIDGCKAGTLGKVIEVNKKNIFGYSTQDYQNPEITPGDGTVPLESSTNLPIDQQNKYYALVADHGKMPSQDGIRQQIVNLISGGNLNVAGNLITQDISKCHLNGKAISVFSPVNIFVTDQNGNRLGLASDGSVINEIPNADFEIMGQHKFIYLPYDNGQTYTINMQGTDTGTYTIKSQSVASSQVVGTEVFSNLPVTSELTGQINVGSGGATTLSVQQTSSGTPATIFPSATLDAPSSEDVLPPASSATLAGTVGQPGFYKSNVLITIKSTDDLAGVLNVAYNLDNAGYQKVAGDAATFAVSAEGPHIIRFFSTDKAGNNEQEQTTTFTIDKTAPEAVIQFDPVAKDLKFTSEDNVLVADKDDVITLTDQAGNTTEIDLKSKNRKILMSADIKAIKYNGVAVDVSKNTMAYLWLYDKNKNLKLLSQYIVSKKNYNILAMYDGKNTSLIGKDSTGKILKSISGLKIIKITTSKGDLTWSY